MADLYDQLEKELSDSYTGMNEDDDYFVGFDGYERDSDWIGAAPLVEKGSKHALDQFKYTITNTTGSAVVICLFPGFLPPPNVRFLPKGLPMPKVYNLYFKHNVA